MLIWEKIIERKTRQWRNLFATSRKWRAQKNNYRLRLPWNFQWLHLNGSIPANVLKDTYGISIPYHTKIINDSLQARNFPSEIKLAQVTQVYKEKDPLNKENYHPASVLSHVSKILEKIVYQLINNYK